MRQRNITTNEDLAELGYNRLRNHRGIQIWILKEVQIAASSKFRRENPEKKQAGNTKYRGENPEYMLKWQRAHPEKIRVLAAKRKRQLGYTLLMPLAEGEVGHHVTNEFVIGVPADAHNNIGGRREKHRALVLQWLKANDKKKYKMVLCVLAKEMPK
jgi:hypothetical protein